MVEIYRGSGVEIDASSFRSAELEARHALHERVDEGSNGTEPELWREYFIRLFLLSGVPRGRLEAVAERVRAAHAEAHLWTHALPGTVDALVSLRTAGYRVGVISNADGRMEGALELAGVREHVEFVIDSALVGFEKPGARIFQAGCDALGLEASECMYVGDLFPVDYVGALDAGLQSVLLDPLDLHGERAETVRELGTLVDFLLRR